MAVKKSLESETRSLEPEARLELHPRVKEIIDEEFADYEKYLPTAQDVRVYQRKRAGYWENVYARIKESNENGRADDTAGAAVNE